MFQPRSLLILVTMLVLGSFQNCSPSFKVASDGSLVASSTVPFERREEPTGDTIDSLRSLSARLAPMDVSLSSGVYDTNCLNNTAYDACLFWKSPAASQYVHGGAPIPVPAATGATAPAQLQAHQNFGVRLTSLGTNNSLRTADFDIHYRDVAGTKRSLSLVNGQHRKPLTAGYLAATPEGERYGLEQVQTFFYLNLFKNTMLQKAGNFFASGRNIPVNVYSEEAGFNAFFDPVTNRVEVGFREGTDGTRYSLALNSEVIVHEMAHANIYFANQNLIQATTDYLIVIPCQTTGANKFYVTDSRSARQNEAGVLASLQSTCGHQRTENIESISFCASNSGCLRAIDEGQADFFSHVMFARWPTVGELALPVDLVRYWKRRSLVTKENLTQKMGLIYQDDFLRRSITLPGEIHDVGEVYAEILFDIYTDPGSDRDTFVRTVSEHLRQLSGTSTFVDSKAILLAVDQSMFAGRNQSQIRAHFQNRGF